MYIGNLVFAFFCCQELHLTAIGRTIYKVSISAAYLFPCKLNGIGLSHCFELKLCVLGSFYVRNIRIGLIDLFLDLFFGDVLLIPFLKLLFILLLFLCFLQRVIVIRTVFKLFDGFF